jgi:hypothetical protein
MTQAKKEGRGMSREEKIEEIRAILGDLYQRFAYHQAAPVNAAVANAEYKFVGYRPYTTPELASWARQTPPNPAGVAWNPYVVGRPEVIPTGNMLRF